MCLRTRGLYRAVQEWESAKAAQVLEKCLFDTTHRIIWLVKFQHANVSPDPQLSSDFHWK